MKKTIGMYIDEQIENGVIAEIQVVVYYDRNRNIQWTGKAGYPPIYLDHCELEKAEQVGQELRVYEGTTEEAKEITEKKEAIAMKIIIENEYQGIRIETTSEYYEADIRKANPDFWKWVNVSYDPDTTTFTRQGNIVRRTTIVNGRTIYADWTQYFEFSGCDADENPMEYIIRMIDKDFKMK